MNTETNNLQPNTYRLPETSFAVQVAFAEKFSQLIQQSFYYVLHTKTSVISSFSPSRQLTIQDMVLSSSLQETVPKMYKVYISQQEAIHQDRMYRNTNMYFGSCTYEYLQPLNAVHIHFLTQPRRRPSVLSSERLEERRNDLFRMFTYIQSHYPDVESVVGTSWLYNLHSYTRCFPPQYIDPLKMKRLVPREDLRRGDQYLPLLNLTNDSVWGQFIDVLGNPRLDAVNHFLSGVANANNMSELIDAFPYPTLHTSCPIEFFYEYYQIPRNQ